MELSQFYYGTAVDKSVDNSVEKLWITGAGEGVVIVFSLWYLPRHKKESN